MIKWKILEAALKSLNILLKKWLMKWKRLIFKISKLKKIERERKVKLIMIMNIDRMLYVCFALLGIIN